MPDFTVISSYRSHIKRLGNKLCEWKGAGGGFGLDPPLGTCTVIAFSLFTIFIIPLIHDKF